MKKKRWEWKTKNSSILRVSWLALFVLQSVMWRAAAQDIDQECEWTVSSGLIKIGWETLRCLLSLQTPPDHQQRRLQADWHLNDLLLQSRPLRVQKFQDRIPNKIPITQRQCHPGILHNLSGSFLSHSKRLTHGNICANSSLRQKQKMLSIYEHSVGIGRLIFQEKIPFLYE